MPLPKPKEGDSQSQFMDKCMSNEVMKSEYPNDKQRLAVCATIYKNRNKVK